MRRGRLKWSKLPIRVDEIARSASQQDLEGEPEWAITVNERGETSNGLSYAVGEAALRRHVEETATHIDMTDDGASIRNTVARSTETEMGHWMAVDAGWAVVTDEWVAGVLGTQITDHLRDAPLNLQNILGGIENPDVFQLGFAGRPVAKGGRKGTLYGSSVNEDPDLGEELSGTPLNELGVEHTTHEIGPVKAYFASETGYVELYDGDTGTREFARYIARHVIEHIDNEDASVTTTTSESGTVDEDQETLGSLDELDTVNVTDGGDD